MANYGDRVESSQVESAGLTAGNTNMGIYLPGS